MDGANPNPNPNPDPNPNPHPKQESEAAAQQLAEEVLARGDLAEEAELLKVRGSGYGLGVGVRG